MRALLAVAVAVSTPLPRFFACPLLVPYPVRVVYMYIFAEKRMHKNVIHHLGGNYINLLQFVPKRAFVPSMEAPQ